MNPPGKETKRIRSHESLTWHESLASNFLNAQQDISIDECCLHQSMRCAVRLRQCGARSNFEEVK